jgi:hypothetical protein
VKNLIAFGGSCALALHRPISDPLRPGGIYVGQQRDKELQFSVASPADAPDRGEQRWFNTSRFGKLRRLGRWSEANFVLSQVLASILAA